MQAENFLWDDRSRKNWPSFHMQPMLMAAISRKLCPECGIPLISSGNWLPKGKSRYISSSPAIRLRNKINQRNANRKRSNRVSGGSAPIHSALLAGANHRSDGLIPPRARLKAATDSQTQRWIKHSVLFKGARKHRQMPGLMSSLP